MSAALVLSQVNTHLYYCHFYFILLSFIFFLDKRVFTLLARNFEWVSVHVFLLTVGILSLVCHSAFNNFPLKFWVSWNGLKSKNISGRSSYTRHLNYYVSKGMTACVREVDMSPCSYVLFILELEAIINYLGMRQAWTSYIRFTPVATLCSKWANPFNSHFISGLLNLLMIVDISQRYRDMTRAASLSASLQLGRLQWPQGRQSSQAGQRSSGDGAVVQKEAPVFPDNHSLILRHCLLYLLPNFLICQGMGALHLLPPG